MQRIYYQALQEEIIQKLQSRRRGPSQWCIWSLI
jgi:hypothetical protein